MEDEPRLNAGVDPTLSLRMKQMQTAVIRIGTKLDFIHSLDKESKAE
jgi:hypothetical protein